MGCATSNVATKEAAAASSATQPSNGDQLPPASMGNTSDSAPISLPKAPSTVKPIPVATTTTTSTSGASTTTITVVAAPAAIPSSSAPTSPVPSDAVYLVNRDHLCIIMILRN
jgi:hypothetical protein